MIFFLSNNSWKVSHETYSKQEELTVHQEYLHNNWLKMPLLWWNWVAVIWWWPFEHLLKMKGTGSVTGKYLHKELDGIGTFSCWWDVWIGCRSKSPRAHGKVRPKAHLGMYFLSEQPHPCQWLVWCSLQRTQLSLPGLCVSWIRTEKHFSGTRHSPKRWQKIDSSNEKISMLLPAPNGLWSRWQSCRSYLFLCGPYSSPMKRSPELAGKPLPDPC